MPKVFISYRRSDTQDMADRLYDALSRRLGKANVFMDIDAIRPGEDFHEVLARRLGETDVVLALIGPAWLAALAERSERVRDWVRLELEESLARESVAVIPVLINGASMPHADRLPQPLDALARRNAIPLYRAYFPEGVTKIVRAIRTGSGRRGTTQTEPSVEHARDGEMGGNRAAPDASTFSFSAGAAPLLEEIAPADAVAQPFADVPLIATDEPIAPVVRADYLVEPPSRQGPDLELKQTEDSVAAEPSFLFETVLKGEPPTTAGPAAMAVKLARLIFSRTAAAPAADFASMACDTARRRVVLHGGFTGRKVGGTWTWDGQTWTEQNPATSPPRRLGLATVYDAGHEQVLLFGGKADVRVETTLADTWTWDGRTWAQQHPATSPPARSHMAMTYDAARRQVVIFGGEMASGKAGDTWTWDGQTWKQQHPATSPPARSSSSMVYDAGRKQVLLFGGRASAVGTLRDTWTWDGQTWTEQHPATSPPARSYPSMAYDADHEQVVLFGGYPGLKPRPLRDTWTWDGQTWTLREPVSSLLDRRARAAIGYDAGHERVVLFGRVVSGEDGDIRTWDGQTWTQRKPV